MPILHNITAEQLKEKYPSVADIQGIPSDKYSCDQIALLLQAANQASKICLRKKKEGGSVKIIGTERDYQRYIIDYLIDNNGYIERKCKTNYDRTTAMDRELLFRFLDTTQPDTMAALRKIYNGQTEETIVKFILQSIDNKEAALSKR